MNLKKLFFEDDESEVDKSANNTSTVPNLNKPVVKPAQAVVQPIVNNTFIPTINSHSDEYQKFIAHFDTLFDNSNLPGPDYYEFSKMCQAMSGLGDQQKFMVAFTGLQVQGLTKEKLLESANHYLNILDEDAKNFNSALDGKIVNDIKQKRNAIEAKKAMNLQKLQQIEQLKNEISFTENEISQLTTDVNAQENTASSKANTYKSACDSRKKSITEDIQKITSYIN